MGRTDGDASHAGDAFVLVHAFQVVLRDGSSRAKPDTKATLVTVAIGRRLWTGYRLLIGVLPGNSRGAVIAVGYFLGDTLGKGMELRSVLRIGAAMAVIPDDAMLGYRSYGGDDPVALFLDFVFELQQGIVVGSVAIDGYDHASGLVAGYSSQSLDGERRYSARKHGHGKDDEVILG